MSATLVLPQPDLSAQRTLYERAFIPGRTALSGTRRCPSAGDNGGDGMRVISLPAVNITGSWTGGTNRDLPTPRLP